MNYRPAETALRMLCLSEEGMQTLIAEVANTWIRFQGDDGKTLNYAHVHMRLQGDECIALFPYVYRHLLIQLGDELEELDRKARQALTDARYDPMMAIDVLTDGTDIEPWKIRLCITRVVEETAYRMRSSDATLHELVAHMLAGGFGAVERVINTLTHWYRIASETVQRVVLTLTGTHQALARG